MKYMVSRKQGWQDYIEYGEKLAKPVIEHGIWRIRTERVLRLRMCEALNPCLHILPWHHM
jgi:hypothetical protein